jgi:hypothetical protein
LGQVFQREMIGAEVPYLEHLVGPAMRVEKGFAPHDYYESVEPKHTSLRTRTYKVGNCEFKALTHGTKINALGLKISPGCEFDLNTFFPDAGFPTTSKMTFGGFDGAAGDSVFQADCLGECGNGFSDYVYDVWNSPHIYGFLTVGVMADVNIDAGVLDAAEEWEKAIRAGAGEDYLERGRYNCDRHFDQPAHVAFKLVRVTYVWVGEDMSIGGTCE